MSAAPDYSYIYVLGAVAVIAAIGAYFLLKGGGKNKFKPVDFKKMTIEELGKLCSTMGVPVSGLSDYIFGGGGQLLLGYSKVGEIDRVYEVDGEFDRQLWDGKTRAWKWGEPKKHHLVILRARSKSLLWRYLGMKKMFFVVDHERLVACDFLKRRWSLRSTELMLPYGNTYIHSDAGMEFIDDLSIKRSKEGIMDAMENYAPRVVFLSANIAGRRNLMDGEAEKERKRWDGPKRADDQETTGGTVV